MGTALIVLFGILLPAVTLAIELSSGMCAEVFFDPVATPLHVALVALVPVDNLAVLLDTRKNYATWRLVELPAVAPSIEVPWPSCRRWAGSSGGGEGRSRTPSVARRGTRPVPNGSEGRSSPTAACP